MKRKALQVIFPCLRFLYNFPVPLALKQCNHSLKPQPRYVVHLIELVKWLMNLWRGRKKLNMQDSFAKKVHGPDTARHRHVNKSPQRAMPHSRWLAFIYRLFCWKSPRKTLMSFSWYVECLLLNRRKCTSTKHQFYILPTLRRLCNLPEFKDKVIKGGGGLYPTSPKGQKT